MDVHDGSNLVFIAMPELGGSAVEGVITRWLKNKFDYVEKGEALLEVATDKADLEIPSPVSGVVSEIIAGLDETVAVGRSIAAIRPMEKPLSSVPGGSAYAVREPPSVIHRAVADPKRDVGPGIFISYRRSDEAGFAGRLYDRLLTHFDASVVFMDVDSIELGLDFVDVLDNALSHCQVLLVVVGQAWLTAVDDDDVRRLDNPDDYVRLEIEAALRRKIRIIPILVDDARMPRSSTLPSSIASLARRNGVTISNANFGTGCIELVDTLRRIIGSTAGRVDH